MGTPSKLRLNVGCGKYVLDGWFNVDVQVSPKCRRPPELLADAKSIPLPDGCAETLQAIHVFEHFYRWEVDALIEEWRRLLMRNGVLILELPDLERCCKNILSGAGENSKDPDQLGMWGLYGDPRYQDPYMCHRWAWSPKSLMKFLSDHGFDNLKHEPTIYHPVGRDTRDMRIVGRKI